MPEYPTSRDVLARLSELQQTSAPIKLSIGGTSPQGTVLHNVVVLHDAPPSVVSTVVTEFRHAYLNERGLHILTVSEAAKS
jgi:hypothetical protein